MKKLRAFILAAICAVAAMVFCACGEPKYYHLSYQDIDGITYSSEIPLGADVREGYVVVFTVIVDTEKLSGEPVVKANDKVLKANDKGEYSFTMQSDTQITVEGVSNQNKYAIEFDAGESRTRYTDLAGNALSTITVDAGEEVSFKIITSAYCVGDPLVSANTTILEPQNGVYTFTATEKTTISVSGLTTDIHYRARKGGGVGTAEDPFKISRPMDLYAMAYEIQEGFYVGVQSAYYELTNDIDLNGEQLYVIGNAVVQPDSIYTSSYFAGHFNGNGYTVKNFYIEDSIIDQTTYTKVFLPYVGMFGLVTASSNGSASITNLNLDNYEIRIDGSSYIGDSVVGSLVGSGAGVEISGCSVNGEISVDASNEIVNNRYCYSYVGGIAGTLRQYVDGNYAISSSVRSCVNNTRITVQSGNAAAVGGIVGLIEAYSEQIPVSVLNSYNTADIYGGQNAGGIVGVTSPCVAIENCYNTGNITAETKLAAGLGFNGRVYAGGIAGSVNYGSVIANCFSVGEIDAIAPGWAIDGDIVGKADSADTQYVSGKSSITDIEAVIYNCHNSVPENKEVFYKNTLGWLDGDWKFDGDYPVINFESTSVTFTVKVRAGNNDLASASITDSYVPLVRWYELNGGIPMFVSSGNNRSYGYYFDSMLKYPVPSSFVPVGDITFYASLVDYSAVIGTYAIPVNIPVSGSTVTLSLNEDGSLYYEYGARNGTSYYSYDGNRIILADVGLNLHKNANNQSTAAYEAVVEGGNLKIYDSASKIVNITDFTAVKVAPGFAYGEYVVNGVSYLFNRDGTGERKDGTTKDKFSYTVTLTGEIAFTAGGISYTASVEGGSVTNINSDATVKLNEFAGVWKKSAAVLKRYEFDGLSGYTYVEYSYDSSGNEIEIDRKSGTYTVSGGTATLAGGISATAEFDENGFMVVDGEEYHLGDELCGDWVFNSDKVVELSFGGISKNGFGYVSADFGLGGVYDLTYAIIDNEVSLYLNEFTFGIFEYSAQDKTLTGAMIDYELGAYVPNITFFAYDGYKGNWVADNGDILTVEFNGLGNYDVKGNENHLAIRGTVKINGVSAGTYGVTDSLSAAFTYNGTEYAAVYNEITNTITVTGGSESFTLARRDHLTGVVYAAEDGSTYAFDGRGNLAAGGGLTVTSASGTAEYTYHINGNGTITVEANGKQGSITLNNNRYDFTFDGATVSLHIHTEFKGTWLVSKTNGVQLEISDVDALGTASGIFDGDEISLSYNAADNSLTFTLDGVDYNITVLSAIDGDQTVYELRLTDGVNSAICIPLNKRDSYAGVYQSEKSEKSAIILDGFYNSFNTSATAVVAHDNGTGSEFAYEPDQYGRILFKEKGVTKYILFESDNGEFVKDGKHYKLVEPDVTNGRTGYALNKANNTVNRTITYLFDGVSKVYDSEGNVIYTYTLIEQTEDDILKLVIRATFTDNNGKSYNVEINYGSGEFLVSMNVIA